MFKHRKLECPVKIKLSRKRFYPSKLMKYFGDKIDENLNWKDQTHDISTKLKEMHCSIKLEIMLVLIL